MSRLQSIEDAHLDPSHPGEFRRRMEQAAQERVTLRSSELEAQASPGKDSRERIELWERIHALALPKSLSHALVGVIANDTRLTVAEVQDEQRRRAEARNS